MKPRDILTNACKQLTALFDAGFRRTKLRFDRTGPDVQSMIELQPRRSNPSYAISFAVNFGVRLNALTDETDRERPERLGPVA